MKRINLAAPELEYDSDDPDGFRAGLWQLGPRQSICPYHYEVARRSGRWSSPATRPCATRATATAYPDSEKVGVWTGDPHTDLIIRRSSGVEYYDGER
jgi:hypothetical protein